MPALLFLLGLPIAEIILFILIGDEIGVSGVLLWILLSAIAGMVLIRAQGQHMIDQARRTVEDRSQPMADAMAGLCAIVGGVLLIIPGFLTDMVGIAFALPGLRNITAGWLQHGLQQRAQAGSGGANADQGPFPGNPSARSPNQGQDGPAPVIEGEFTVVDEDQAAKPDDQGKPSPSGGSVPPYGGGS